MWTDYSLKSNVYVIRNRATCNGNETVLETIEEWASIEPEIRISNVDRLLLGYHRCPVDNRRPDKFEGVPITFGSEKIIADIYECLKQIAQEYDLKKAFVGVDSNMFDKSDKLHANGLIKKFMIGGKLESGPFFEEFFPDIRDSSYSASIVFIST